MACKDIVSSRGRGFRLDSRRPFIDKWEAAIPFAGHEQIRQGRDLTLTPPGVVSQERLWPPQSFVKLGDHRVHYAAAGRGPALVLVHGFAGYSFTWRRNLDALGQRFRVYALDLPGFGYSDRPPGYPYSIRAAADLIQQFADAVGERQVCLVGHSWGGAASLLCAASDPALVRKLVLAAPVNPFDRHLVKWLAVGGTPVLADVALHGARLAIRSLAAWLLRHVIYGDPRRVTDETIEGYVGPLRHPTTVTVFRRTFAAWDLESINAALPNVSQPVMLLWGDRDRVVRPESSGPLAAALRAELRIVANCGHLLPEEAPEIFDHLLLEFLLRD